MALFAHRAAQIMGSEPDPRDPIKTLNELVDGFTDYVHQADEAAYKSTKYRLNLLWIHALFALAMAPAFIGLGREGMAGNAWEHLRDIPGSPTSIAMLLFLGGGITGVGCLLVNRKVEAAGLVFLGAFYLVIAIGFAWANLDWALGNLPTGNKPAPYAPILYLHFATIMVLHFATLIGLIRRDHAHE